MQGEMDKDKGIDDHFSVWGVDRQVIHDWDVLGSHIVAFLQVNLVGEFSSNLVQGAIRPVTKPVQNTSVDRGKASD